MARTLDALDAALHSDPNLQRPDAQQGKPGQGQGQGEAKNGKPSPDAAAQQAMAQAQNALAAAGQAAAQAMRSQRGDSPAKSASEEIAQGDFQAKSQGGVRGDAPNMAYGALPEVAKAKANNWGKLPKKMAEELSHGQSESVPGEYRNQIETYYRVIAEKAKQQK